MTNHNNKNVIITPANAIRATTTAVITNPLRPSADETKTIIVSLKDPNKGFFKHGILWQSKVNVICRFPLPYNIQELFIKILVNFLEYKSIAYDIKIIRAKATDIQCRLYIEGLTRSKIIDIFMLVRQLLDVLQNGFW